MADLGDCEVSDLLRDSCRGVRAARRLSQRAEDWVQTMVAAGLGIAMLNDGFVHAHLASP
jgi:hypothetical protein